MRDLGDMTSNRTWHEDDFLVRALANDIHTSDDVGRASSIDDVITDPMEMKFGAVTLGLVSSDAPRHERLALLRSRAFVDRDLHSFGARVRSRWAFDALAGRLTRQAHDWESFRALLLAHAGHVADAEPVLDAVALDRLFALSEMLHERNQDEQAERALVSFIANRVAAGGSASKTTRQRLAERALQFDNAEDARRLADGLGRGSWARLALRLELSHPRFGGTFDGLLRRFNAPLRRLGLETVHLDDGADSPFDRLDAAPESSIGQGPLVSVILDVVPHADHVVTAVRSIVAQTYTNWELLIVDGDPAGVAGDIAARFDGDERIRVLRADPGKNGTEYRNEGIAAARGDFVTFQSTLSWSHPRRLEVQISDLLLHRGRVANLVHEAHVSQELSFITDRGVKLFKAESTLMIRSDVIRTIGGFDPVPEGAERELRKRLELNAHRPVPALVPGAPLILTLAPLGELRGRDYGVRAWEPAELSAYRSAARLRRELPLDEKPGRSIPAAHTGHVDVVVVLDARESSRWDIFHGTVADEIRRAAAAGLTVGILHSDALLGPHGTVRYAAVLEELLADGLALRVDGLREVDARLVVVRHAGAAQGHLGAPLPIRAGRVVIVEDPDAGDVRGRTIAVADVENAVDRWFGASAEWTRALPNLPTPTVSAVAFDATGLRVTLQSAVSQLIRGVRISNGSEHIDLQVMVGTSDIVASADAGVIAPGKWEVTVDHATDEGAVVVSRRAAVSADAFVWNGGRHLVVKTGDGSFEVLPQDGTNGVDDLTAHYLAAKVTSVRVNGERANVAVETSGATYLLEVFAQREVESGAIRRRDFTVTTTDGRRVWSRPLTKFADSRWRLFGAFRTSLGVIHYPISMGSEATVEGTPLWTPRILAGDRILIAPPEPTKIQRAARRVGAGVRVDALRRSILPERRAGEVRFDSRHSQPRVAGKPTVSVVMPVYNVEPYLEAAISSVLDQDFRDIELILVDDASKDGGRRIIQKYWKKDPRVRVFGLDHNTLGGAGIPSNVGVRAARGEYVAFADSDDQVTNAGLAGLVEAAETHDADLVIGDFRTFTDKLTEGAESYDRHVWSSIPTGTPLSAVENTDLFRLSPVPWRKLYRRAFLEEHAILYPEGDYFYEDNPLHWFVLSRARRVVLCDEVISFHRMEREGQTMSAQTYKLGAFVNHMNTVLNSLMAAEPAHRDILIESFANYLDRTLWVATKQTQPAAAAMIRRGFAEIYERAIEAAPAANIPEKTRTKLTTFRSAYLDPDLTIVVPVYNSSGLLKPTLDSLLSIRGLRFDVLLVDDGSTDDSLAVMEDYEKRFSNVHVFAQGNRGAGRARNSVIPLASGRYTYFLDADDVIDANALVAAVAQADEESSDLLFMKYRIEYTDEGRSRGMFEADVEAWTKAAKAAGKTRQRAVAQLINYPWNRLIRTRLLHDGNIFFGPTVVHNDVLFHWHTIARATRISLFDGEVCIHRKFTSRDQITNINDARRLAVLEALRGTHERISPLESYSDIRDEWIHFAQHLLSWAASRIPEELRPVYEVRRRELGQVFERVAGFSE